MKNNLPFNVMRYQSWDRAPRAEAIALAIVGAGASATTLFITTALVSIGISAVTSWAISALSPKPDFSSFGSNGTLVNSRDAAAPADFIYGQVRKGGTVSFYESTGDKNKFLHQIIVLAGHEIAEVGDIYINDEVVTIDGNDFVTGDTWNSKIRIQKFDGSQTTAPADLLAESELTGSDALTSNFVGNDIAYLYVRYEYDQDVFANGIPLVTAVVKGKKVYDPRTGVTAYSNNAALCMRDFITSVYGLKDTAIDDVSFSAAANESDENVTLSGGGTEKRYTINGIVKSSTPIGQVLGQMSTACAGTLFWGSGYWKLKVGAYSSPVKTLTLDDLRGPIDLQTRTSMRDSFNGVGGTFNNASDNFITADYPPIKSSTFQTEDGGDELILDLPLPYTTSSATAQRIAKMTLYRGREQMTISADFGLEAFNVEVGDIIAFDNPRYGFDGKEFEVVGWRFGSDQDAGDLRVNLTLQETSAAAFNWNATESDIIGNNTNLPDGSAGLTITNLTASAGGRTQGDGTFINTAILGWDEAASAFVTHYEVEWRVAGDTAYNSTTTTENSIEISPLVDSVQYQFRVRSVTASGNFGVYATVNLTAGGDTTAPALPTSISAEGSFRYITVSWTNPADTDLKYVEVWENSTNSSGGSSLVGKSGGSEFVRPNLDVNVTKFYFLRAVDHSGNTSAYTTGVSATTTFVDDDDFENGVYTLFTDQGLYAIKDVSTLPASGTFTGEKVFNTTDAKLYSWTGSAWEATVADVGAGSITATEIQDGAISTPKLAANSVIASKILGGTITGDKITANTITGGLIAASGIITNSAQITDAVVTNAKIANLAVGTIKVADRAITSQTAVFVSSNSTTGTNLLAASLSISADAGEEILFGTTFEVKGSGTDKTGSARAYLNGSLLVTGSGTDSFNSFTAIRSITATQGTNTLQIYLDSSSPGIAYLSNASLFALEAFK